MTIKEIACDICDARQSDNWSHAALSCKQHEQSKLSFVQGQFLDIPSLAQVYDFCSVSCAIALLEDFLNKKGKFKDLKEEEMRELTNG